METTNKKLIEMSEDAYNDEVDAPSVAPSNSGSLGDYPHVPISVVHTNANYAVYVEYEDLRPVGYCVLNHTTGVSELSCETLMEAIDFAEHSNSFVANELWRWIAQKGAQMRKETNLEELTAGD